MRNSEFLKVIQQRLIGPKGCTLLTSDLPDTRPYAPKTDLFKHHLRIGTSALGQTTILPLFFLVPVFASFFGFFCRCSSTFFCSSNEQHHSDDTWMRHLFYTLHFHFASYCIADECTHLVPAFFASQHYRY